jgi:hypothetical protein
VRQEAESPHMADAVIEAHSSLHVTARLLGRRAVERDVTAAGGGKLRTFCPYAVHPLPPSETATLSFPVPQTHCLLPGLSFSGAVTQGTGKLWGHLQ